MATASHSGNELGSLNLAQTFYMERMKGVELDRNDILQANVLIDEFANELSQWEMQMGSSKARTTTNLEYWPCIGPAASLDTTSTF